MDRKISLITSQYWWANCFRLGEAILASKFISYCNEVIKDIKDRCYTVCDGKLVPCWLPISCFQELL